MTPLRALSIGLALLAGRRWPVFGAVGGLLGVEAVAGELAALATTQALSSLAWGSAFASVSGIGASLGMRSIVRPVGLFLACLLAAVALAPFPRAYALTTAAACAYALAVLVSAMAPHDMGRASALLLLGGNLAACVIAAALGIQDAYRADLVLWSNNITHLSISGLALWTMRAR